MTLILNGTDNSATVPAVTGTDTDTGIYYPTSNQVAIATNGTQAMLVDASQNVGIGTATPTAGYKLNVGSSSAVTTLNGAAITLFTSGGLTSNVGGVLNFRPQLGTTISDIFNLSICAYDHSGDGNADGLSINGSDGVSFSTGGNSRSERMRIASDGTVFVNTTTSVSAGKFIVAANSATTNAIVIQDTSTSYGAGVYFQTFVNSTGNLAGYVAHTGSTTVNFGSVSDYRLKENVAPITNSLAKICQLKPVSYKWKEDGSFGEGFIAHELQEIIPLAVDGEKDAIGLDDKIKPQGVDPSKVVVHLVAAIQELKAEFDAYKATHP
jgi:hypothetical protein